MTSVFRKVVDDDGNETFVEVDPNEIELPEAHPIRQELERVKQESIKRRQRIKELRAQLEAEERGGDSAQAAPKPREASDAQAQPGVDLDRLRDEVKQRVLEEIRAAQVAEAQRKQEIDTILKETGLSERFRTVIERIPDLTTAKATALDLAREVSAFDKTPSDGAGAKPTINSVTAMADKLLGLPDD